MAKFNFSMESYTVGIDFVRSEVAVEKKQKQEVEDRIMPAYQVRFNDSRNLSEFDMAKLNFSMESYAVGIDFIKSEINRHHPSWDLFFLEDVILGKSVTPIGAPSNTIPTRLVDVSETLARTSIRIKVISLATVPKVISTTTTSTANVLPAPQVKVPPAPLAKDPHAP